MHCCQSNWLLMIGDEEEQEETADLQLPDEGFLHCKNHLFEMINDHQRILHIIIVIAIIVVVAKKWI